MYDAQGRPIRLHKARTPKSPVDRLAELGMRQLESGDVVMSRESIEQRANDRARAYTLSKVPSTPRDVIRGYGPAVEKGHGQYAAISFHQLRMLRERSLLIQAIHAARRAAMRRYAVRWSGREGDVGWDIRHERHHEKEFDLPDEMVPVINRAKRMMSQPSERYCRSLTSALVMLEEDLLTINRPSVEVMHSLFDGERMVGWRPIDGGIIWPTLEWLEVWQASDASRRELDVNTALDQASRAVGFDMHGAEFALVRQGVIEQVYRPGELIVSPLQTRTDVHNAGYPPSQLEESLLAITAWVNAWVWNDSRFTRGLVNDYAIGISGDVAPEDVHAFRDQLNEVATGINRAHQPPIMSLPMDGALQRIELGAMAGDMQYGEWMSAITSVACAIYRMDPSTINIKPWDPSGGSKLSEANRSHEIQSAKMEGLIGDLEHLASEVLTPIVQRIHPELVFIFETGEEAARSRAELADMRSKVDITRNEVRIGNGDHPIGFYLDARDVADASDEDQKKYFDNPWNHTTDGQLGTFLNQVAMQKQFGQGGGEQDADGFGGPPGGESGAPFGQPAGPKQDDEQPAGPPQQPQQEQGAPRDPYANMSKARLAAEIERLTNIGGE